MSYTVFLMQVFAGYGQCTYTRFTSTEGKEVHCSFVMGKALVAP